MVLSYSGETSDALRIAEQAKAAGAPVIALTSYGRNPLSSMADVTLHVSTREKLVEQLGCYGMSISTMLLLDVIYSCVLALDYDRNVINRIKVTRSYEIYRDSDNPILHDRR
ncbi:MAG: SIS domain-containing protein [Atopobiaceae bacterium]|nr:SIS domain-containing protein [Atopobiaceae bacterium]